MPFGSVLFDRLIAHTRVTGTAVFAIYVADAVGYSGSITVQLIRDLFFGQVSRLDFFLVYALTTSLVGVLFLSASAVYFLLQRERRPGMPAGTPASPLQAPPTGGSS